METSCYLKIPTITEYCVGVLGGEGGTEAINILGVVIVAEVHVNFEILNSDLMGCIPFPVQIFLW